MTVISKTTLQVLDAVPGFGHTLGRTTIQLSGKDSPLLFFFV